MNRLHGCLITGWIAVLMILGACSPKKIPRTIHEKVDGDISALAVSGAEGHSILPSDEVLDIFESKLSTLHNEDLWSEVLVPLQAYALDSNRIGHPEYSKDKRLRRALKIFNRALLKYKNLEELARQEELGEKLESLLTSYHEAILAGCDEDLNGCFNLGFFASDFRSAQIILYFAHRADHLLSGSEKLCSKDLENYYRYLYISYALKNQTLSPRLTSLYVKRSKRFHECLSQRESSLKTMALLSRHRRIFAMIVTALTEQTRHQEIDHLVDSPEVFTYNHSSKDPLGEPLLRLGVQTHMYTCSPRDESCSDPKLSQSFRKALGRLSGVGSEKANFTESEEFRHQSLARIQAEIERPQNAQVLRQLKVDLKFSMDEYFFIIDGLYRDRLSTSLAAHVWQYTLQDHQRFFTLAKKYIRLQMVRLILKTNQYIRDSFSNDELSSGSLVEKTVEESREVAELWQNMQRKVEDLSSFVYRNLYGVKNYEQRKNFLDTLSKNIKFMVTYPNMLALVHKMTELNAPVDFSITSPRPMTFEVPTNQIIKDFFGDKQKPWMRPWFAFSDDSTHLSRYQLLFAFDFALKTNVLQNQVIDQGAASAKRGEIDFLKVVAERYLVEDTKYLRDELKQLEKGLDNQYDQFVNLCSHPIVRDVLSGATPEIDEEKVRQLGTFWQANVNMGKLGNLRNFTFAGSSEFFSEEGIVHAGTTTYTSENKYVILNNIRKKIQPKIHYVRMLVKILSRDRGLSTSVACESGKGTATEDALCDVDRILQEREEMIAKIYGILFQRHKKVSKCLNVFAYVERARQKALIRLEKRHLQKVHGWMTALRRYGLERSIDDVLSELSGSSESQEQEVLSALTEVPEPLRRGSLKQVIDRALQIPAELIPVKHKKNDKRKFTGEDQIVVTEDDEGSLQLALNYAHVDLLFRLYQYMREGVTSSGQPIGKNASITIPKDLGELPDSIFDNRTSDPVPYVEDREVFVNNALRTLNGSTDKLKWRRRTDTGYIDEKVKLMLELYQAGRIETLQCRKKDLAQTGNPARYLHFLGRWPSARDHHPGVVLSGSKGSDKKTQGGAFQPVDPVLTSKCIYQAVAEELTAHDLGLEILELVNLSHVPEEDISFLAELGLDSWYSPGNIRPLFINKDNEDRSTTFFESSYEYLIKNPSEANPKPKDIIDLGKSLFDNVRGLGSFLFPIDHRLKENLRCHFKPLIEKRFQAIKGFETMARELDQNRSIDFFVDQLGRRQETRDMRGRMTYLSHVEMEDESKRRRQFHSRKTQGFFRENYRDDQGATYANCPGGS